MVSPLTERAKVAEKLPWVTRLEKPVPCEGIKWSLMTMRRWDQIRNGGGVPFEVKCRKRAHWHFKALKRTKYNGYTKTGNYCWSHLLYRGIYGSQEEEKRTQKWMEEHPEEWQHLW